MPLLLMFVLFPIAELALLIYAGASFGVVKTLLWVLATGVIGVLVLRLNGLATLLRARERLLEGQSPALEIADGFLRGLGAVLLISPGLMCDVFGVLLLLPRTRSLFAARAAQSLRNKGRLREPLAEGYAKPERHRNDQQPTIIEGEFRREK